MARIMAAQAESDNNPMYDMYKNLPRVLEINPRSPLIEGLLSRVLDLPSEPTEEASLDEIELTETARILFDTTLVRSGFNVPDSNEFFDRIEALLRSSLGVRLDARTDTHVRPAPPTAAELPADNTVELETDADIEVEEEAEEDPWAEFEKLGLKVESGDNEDWPSDDDFMDWDAFKNSLGHDEL
jgi:heat shock protein beta